MMLMWLALMVSNLELAAVGERISHRAPFNRVMDRLTACVLRCPIVKFGDPFIKISLVHSSLSPI